MQDNPIITFKETIFSSDFDFESTALAIFRFQYLNNNIYRQYVDHLGIQLKNVTNIKEIPFLPIEFFKSHVVKSSKKTTEKIYKSSGTGQTGRSSHHMVDNNFYLTLAQMLFEIQYGPLDRWVIAAILPSYQQQGDSSLIAMTDHFMMATGSKLSGYYLEEPDMLASLIPKAEKEKKRILFLGVTYALLQLSESEFTTNDDHLIMETGGMKGRGKELVREELHQVLKAGLGVSSIHSEYGMTELTSQAYSKANGIFSPSKTMKVLARDINDPRQYVPQGRTGGANIIDLANFASCSFIETKDLCRVSQKGFEILGRFDNSDIRGCNLLVT